MRSPFGGIAHLWKLRECDANWAATHCTPILLPAIIYLNKNIHISLVCAYEQTALHKISYQIEDGGTRACLVIPQS
jgi:hypothetical protein